MTDKNNADLIADVRSIDSDWVLDNSPDDTVETIRELADALEAADQRADQAEATAEHLHDEDTREIVALTQERDAALAVIEKVREALLPDQAKLGRTSRSIIEEVRSALASAPASADTLREHDAALIEGLADEFAARLPDGTGNGRAYNSHTVARMLREKARQRRLATSEQAGREPSDADFNRAAQTFYEASGLNLPHTSKPEVVAGVRAAWSALLAAQEERGAWAEPPH